VALIPYKKKQGSLYLSSTVHKGSAMYRHLRYFLNLLVRMSLWIKDNFGSIQKLNKILQIRTLILLKTLKITLFTATV
jgi:hypothetical protein